MGWNRGTEIFDTVAGHIATKSMKQRFETSDLALLTKLARVLEGQDWDTPDESEFADHPQLKKILGTGEGK